MSATAVESALVRRVTEGVAERLAAAERGNGQADPMVRGALAEKFIGEALTAVARDRIARSLPALDEQAEDELADRVRAQLFGLADLERLLRDESVEDVLCNSWDEIWLRYADGRRERVAPITDSEDALRELLRHAAATQGRSERRFDQGQPWASFALSDGSRLTAVQDVSGATVFALRRHRHVDVDMTDLRALGTVGPLLAALLGAAARSRRNILIVGGTNAGKTTLLRALLNEIDPDERLVTVEDTRELHLRDQPDRHRNVVELECREPNVEGKGEVTMRDLTRLALRLSPDRVVVGEVRGPEILDMFQAMSQGNDGSMGTLHARSTADAFVQTMRYALKAPEHLTPEAVAVDIAASLDLVVHVARLEDGRRAVTSVREVVGHDGATVLSNEVLRPDHLGRAVPTPDTPPLRDTTLDALCAAGFDPGLFDLPGEGWES